MELYLHYPQGPRSDNVCPLKKYSSTGFKSPFKDLSNFFNYSANSSASIVDSLTK